MPSLPAAGASGEAIVLAIARATSGTEPVGIHRYSFGGVEQTCAWVDAVTQRRFALDDEGGFVAAVR